MQDSDGLSDDVPIADAVEQQRAATDQVSDDDAPDESFDDVPLEASGADWQEQREVVIDPEPEEFDHD
jgi:hypothetical protein